MADPNLIIVSVMGRSDLHCSGTKLHVDDNGVRDDWDFAVNKRMNGQFSVKMLQVVYTADARRGS